MLSSPSLSTLVLLAFLACAGVFLLLAKVFARKPENEIWLAAVTIVVLSCGLLWVLSDLGVLLSRTPALIHTGFAGLALLWATLRRETSALSAAGRRTYPLRDVLWLMAIPAGGVVLTLPLLGGIAVP